MNELVKLDVIEGIARITLNRPKAYNAFGLDMVKLLSERLIELAMNKNAVGIIITGEGKAFCAGADLRWVSDFGKSYGETLHELSARYHQAILEIRRMSKPVIAAINGIAAGGGFSMALACDFRIMETSAVLQQAYTTNGLSIDGGGTFNLPRLVGLARAMEIAAFDYPISSEQALSWGLVTEVVEDGQAVKRAIELINEMKNGTIEQIFIKSTEGYIIISSAGQNKALMIATDKDWISFDNKDFTKTMPSYLNNLVEL